MDRQPQRISPEYLLKFPSNGGKANFFEDHHCSEALIPLASQVKPFQQEVATSLENSQGDDSSTCCLAAALSSAIRFSI
jgi:hypothetical protein